MNTTDLLFWIAQVISWVGAALTIFSFQMKDNKRLYILQSVGGLLFAISFAIPGNWSGALLNSVNILRGGVLAAGKKWSSPLMFVIIEIFYLVSGIVSYDNWLSILVTVAQMVGTIALWSRNGRTIRIVQFFVISPSWLIYNIFASAGANTGGIVTEVFGLASVIISIIRYGWNGFEDEPSKKATVKAAKDN